MIRKAIDLLELLLSRNDYLSLNELKTVFQKSERAIRYEIEKADALLKTLHLPQIEQKRKSGFKLTFTDLQKDEFNTYLKVNQYKVDYYTAEERLLMIIFSILDETHPTLGKNLADDLIASKSTVDSDMKKLRKIGLDYGLTIQSVPKKGFRFIGDEWSIRMLIANLCNGHLNLEKTINNCKDEQVLTIKEKVILDYLNADIFWGIYSILRKMGQTKSITLNEVYCRQLAIMLSVWYRRIKQGYKIEECDIFPYTSKKLHSYKIAAEFMNELLKNEATANIDEAEINYLCYIIDSFNLSPNSSLKKDWGEAQMITIRLIEQMETGTSIPFSEDKELVERLFNHIKALMDRIKKRVSIFNPLKNMIMDQYAFHFQTTKRAVKIIEKYCKQVVSDEEIAYITVHFSASAEKLKQSHSEKYRVVIICGHGIGTGALLAENLKKYDEFDVIGVLNSYNLDAVKRLDADFALKTIDIEVDNIPSLKIDPVLNDYDRKKIQKFLEEHPDIQKSNDIRFDATTFFKEICEAVETNSQRINMTRFVADLETLFEKNKFVINKKGIQPMLSEMLKDHQILLKKEATGWEEVIRRVALPLLEENYIDENYIQAMIDVVKRYGPYIVIGKGVALAHARPEDGVKKLGLSVMTLAHPVWFGNEENDPVKLIFCLAAVDSFSHLKIMKSIVSLIDQAEKIEQLVEQKSLADFKKVLYQHEEAN